VRRLNAAFVNVAEKVSPSVVVVRVHPKSEPLEGHEEFLQLLPEELRRRWLERLEQQVEQGSGVIIREDGHILTNGHVIENAERIEGRLRDGRSYIAQVRGIDPDS